MDRIVDAHAALAEQGRFGDRLRTEQSLRVFVEEAKIGAHGPGLEDAHVGGGTLKQFYSSLDATRRCKQPIFCRCSTCEGWAKPYVDREYELFLSSKRTCMWNHYQASMLPKLGVPFDLLQRRAWKLSTGSRGRIGR